MPTSSASLYRPDLPLLPEPTGFMRQRLMNKVPEVTLWFWIIKILCTTVGESAADFLNYNLNWGLTKTSVLTGVLFFAVLAWQMLLRRYVAGVYWLTVVLVSVFGTLVTDNLTDNLGVPLEVSTIVFSVLLAVVFLAWYASERTLSIHSIYTRRRESFYWVAILVTFALGTATGDLVSEVLGLGYLLTGILCLAIIGLVTLGWRLGLNAVLAFWIAYILTRPLGASLGDFLAQPKNNGGLGLGVTVTSAIFLSAILATIVYLSIRKPDVTAVPTDALELAALDEPETAPHHHLQSRRTALVQTVVVVTVFVVGFLGFYIVRMNQLNAEASTLPAPTAGPATETVKPTPLGDLSGEITITQDTLALLEKGQQAQATARITDLETLWDNSEAVLKHRDGAAWTAMDDKIDPVLRELRSTTPNVATENAALQALLQQEGVITAPTAASVKATPLGDLSGEITITQDTLALLEKGQQAQATARITDLETLWDNSEAVLKHRDGTAWTAMDDKIDPVLRELRSTTPNVATEKAALQALLQQEGVTTPATGTSG